MSNVQRIAKNISFLLISQIINVIFGFFYTIYMARYLGAEGFGILSFAIAFTGIFAIFVDLGLSTLAVREISKEKKLESYYISNIMLIKVILSVLTFGLSLLVLNILDYPKQIIEVVNIVMLSIIITSFSQVISSVFQVHQKLEYQSFCTVLNSILMFLGVITAIYHNFSVTGFAYLYLSISIIIFVINILIYKLKFVSPIIEINLKKWKSIIASAIPLGLLSIFVIIFVRVDSVMLSKLVGEVAVGWYNAAFVIVQNLSYLTSAIMTVLFPLFSKFHANSETSFKELYQKSFKYLLIIAIPIGIFTSISANAIILLVYGNQYINSGIALQILVWWYVIGSINWLFGTVLNSTNRQNIFLFASFICLLFNVILNLYLIPIFSFVGASITTIATELILFCILFYFFPKNIYKPSLLVIFKPLLASIIMGVCIYILKWINIIPLLILAFLIYSVALIGLGGINADDIKMLKIILKK